MVRLQEPVIGHGLNDEQIGITFNNTPLVELSGDTRKQLACMLNRKKVLRSEEGYERDWRGIASLAQQRGFVDECANNPMELVLSNWSRHSPQTATFGHLEKFLGIIDRWDVCDDIQENLSKDTQRFNIKQQLEHERQCPTPPQQHFNETNNNHLGRNINTVSDYDAECLQKGHPLPKYNACVLYAEADIDFATEIMRNLEDPPYNLKLFLRDRDFQCGVPFEHVELSHFMATRCNHLIVVLTEDFLRSPENAFLVNFTQKLQIESQTRKIIPVLYKQNMIIPPTLNIYTHLKFTGSTLFNFWDKLAKSLMDVDMLAIYYGTKVHEPTAPEAIQNDPIQHVIAPETPRLMLNDNDMPDNKLSDAPLVSMVGATSAPLPELKLKKKEKLLHKLSRNFGTASPVPAKPLRHALSVSAINASERERTLSASSSNISTTSESKKSSIKWRPKILKKMFTRSSTKLQRSS